MMTLEETHDKYVKMRQHVALREVEAYAKLEDWPYQDIILAWVAFGLGEREEMPGGFDLSAPRRGTPTS
jgi:hypothetical protein